MTWSSEIRTPAFLLSLVKAGLHRRWLESQKYKRISTTVNWFDNETFKFLLFKISGQTMIETESRMNVRANCKTIDFSSFLLHITAYPQFVFIGKSSRSVKFKSSGENQQNIVQLFCGCWNHQAVHVRPTGTWTRIPEEGLWVEFFGHYPVWFWKVHQTPALRDLAPTFVTRFCGPQTLKLSHLCTPSFSLDVRWIVQNQSG